MNRNLELIDRRFIYVTEVRYHLPDYAYRLAVEKEKDELVICHQIRDEKDREKWVTTHSIGIKKDDLSKILETIK